MKEPDPLLKRVKVLTDQGSWIVRPTIPFDFDGTVFRPDHFPSKDVEWKPGTYWQTLRWNCENFGIKLQRFGTNDRPRIKVSIFAKRKPSQSTVKEILGEIGWRFDLDSTGVPTFVDKFRRDRYIGSAIRRHRGMRLKSGYSLYEYLVITVMLQNTLVRRSVSMLQALFDKYGEKVSFDGRILCVFWDSERIQSTTEEMLRSLKLGYRARTLKRQAEHFAYRRISEDTLRQIRDPKAVANALDDIYGVGPQSAWYLASEFFHFYDSLDHISRWEGRIVSRILFRRITGVSKLQTFFTQRYGEFRLLAFAYLMIDLFWQHRESPIDWLSRMVKL